MKGSSCLLSGAAIGGSHNHFVGGATLDGGDTDSYHKRHIHFLSPVQCRPGGVYQAREPWEVLHGEQEVGGAIGVGAAQSEVELKCVSDAPHDDLISHQLKSVILRS